MSNKNTTRTGIGLSLYIFFDFDRAPSTTSNEDRFGCYMVTLNHYPTKLIHLNFQPLEVVSRYRDPQLRVAENLSYLFNLGTDICKS